jgi:hypothetical protein
MKTRPRPPIRFPGLVLDHLGLSDTEHHRQLLAQVDGALVVDFTAHARIRALSHLGVGLYAPGTRWLIGYIYDDREEVAMRTYPTAAPEVAA